MFHRAFYVCLVGTSPEKSLSHYGSQKGSTFENLMFLKQPSNSEHTSRTVMRALSNCTSLLYDSPSHINPMIPVTAVHPLYLRMINEVRNAPPGMRNFEFRNIIPQMGLLHTSMAMLETAKDIFHDALFDGLVSFSGLSKGAQERFT